MLHIDLERQVPEALKPRQIRIASDVTSVEKDVVDAKAVN
jgi:molecular chaperone IbpA